MQPNDAPQPPLRLVTIKEVAQRLKVSIRTVRRLIDNGQIPVHRIGRAVRISEADFAVYLGRTRDNGL